MWVRTPPVDVLRSEVCRGGGGYGVERGAEFICVWKEARGRRKPGQGEGGYILGRMLLPFPGLFTGGRWCRRKSSPTGPCEGVCCQGHGLVLLRKHLPNASSILTDCWKPLPLPTWERPSGTTHLPWKAVGPHQFPLWGLLQLCGSQGWMGKSQKQLTMLFPPGST